MPGTMKLSGTTKKIIDKTKNGENVQSWSNSSSFSPV